MKSRKIYYVPGFISAIFIPLLFWIYGNRKLQEPIPNVITEIVPLKMAKAAIAFNAPKATGKSKIGNA